MDAAEMQNMVAILEEELVPALGCTEPIAIAYAAAKTRAVLGMFPEKATVYCSGNIVKNVKSVTVPNSGGLRGIEAAAILGMVGGNADRELEVLTEVRPEHIEKAEQLLKENFCRSILVKDVDKLYIQVCLEAGSRIAAVTIEGHHTNITHILKDGKVIFEKPYTPLLAQKRNGDRTRLSVRSILEFADAVDLEPLLPTLTRQLQCNDAIADAGLAASYGACVSRAVLSSGEVSPFMEAKRRASAASEARMSGCALPVVINSGSGNQGITVSVPVAAYARARHLSEDRMYRGLIVSNLISIHLKRHIGDLSAFCGAVTASCGVGAALAYLDGFGYQVVADSITNNLASVGGILCDGAKPSCAAKVCASLESAYLSYCMARRARAFCPGEGVVGQDVEQTIRSIGHIGREGMEYTDLEILKVMMQTRIKQS